MLQHCCLRICKWNPLITPFLKYWEPKYKQNFPKQHMWTKHALLIELKCKFVFILDLNTTLISSRCNCSNLLCSKRCVFIRKCILHLNCTPVVGRCSLITVYQFTVLWKLVPNSIIGHMMRVFFLFPPRSVTQKQN